MIPENQIYIPALIKSVTIDTSKSVLNYYVYGKLFEVKSEKLPQVLLDLQTLPTVLSNFQHMHVCAGLGSEDLYIIGEKQAFKDTLGYWRHNKCLLLSANKHCKVCNRLKKTLLQKKSRFNVHKNKRISSVSNLADQMKLNMLRKKLHVAKTLKNRAKLRIQLLQKSLQEKRDELASMEEQSIENKCLAMNINKTQKLAIKEIVAAASTKDGKGRRYSEEWIMLCILMNIRSPSFYDFLRRNNVLPLPCTRTVRKYLSLIDTKCGFNENFSKLLSKHFHSKDSSKRHSVLLLDKINLRRSVNVCSKNLTYVGLTDFGDDGPKSTTIEDQATHGLVFMFQPLADKCTQPIAVFASKGPVKGDELAKLVVKAICFLEKSGAIVHGVIGDGAQTNKKMGSVLGINTTLKDTKNWFTHPLHDDRKILLFSDVPHIIKCIRNRIYNKRRIRINATSNYIEWKYFQQLYEIDIRHDGYARACPHLTRRHMELDNTSKMRVRFATQIFSNSVAAGLKFYSSQKHENLNGYEATADFCTWMNDMFDALNRKMPNQGVTPDSNDYQILKFSLQRLNEWENSMIKGDITIDEFLTLDTAHNLRLSLMSTLDLCQLLIEQHGFKYLLTGKVNQDNLEKFFGTIREAAGCNDHPTCATFLQLYKLLSVYNILKPPKYENCTIDSNKAPLTLVTVSELKEIFGTTETKAAKSQRQLKDQLDKIITYDVWNFDDIIELDYLLSPSIDCIIYYVTGYLCKQFLRRYNACETCKNFFSSVNDNAGSSLSALIDLKSREGLIHSNMHIFNLVRYIESCFAKHAALTDVFDLTIDEVISNYSFSFPCQEHASDVLSYTIYYYVRLRMRQYCYQKNQNIFKKSAVKRKLAKLTNE